MPYSGLEPWNSGYAGRMTTIILNQQEVRRLLPMEACMDLMQQALASLGRGEGVNPLRTGMFLPDRKSLLGCMPGYLAEPRALGIKVVAVMPANHGTELDTHQGLVALFDPERGVPMAIMDASEVTAIRTAAVSGMATRLLARSEAHDLAILGSGVQARTHLEAMLVARDLDRVRVYSPTIAHREAFAERESERHGVRVECCASAHEAVEGADLICTTTSASEPVLFGEWLEPGVHINAVGSSHRGARELDGLAVQRSRLFIDRRESTLNESGDFLAAVEEGLVDESHIVAELGELLLGQAQGREGPDEITLFKSLGLAVEDVAVAVYVHARAQEEGVGVQVDWGGLAL